MKFEDVGELIEILNKFPKDTPLITESSLIWKYPDELKKLQDNMSFEEYSDLTMSKAYCLGIFEGSWEKDNISNVEGKLELLLKQ